MMKNKNDLKMIPCAACGTPMPELRFTKYGYKVCIKCSTVKAKSGVPVMFGSKDHTWTDLVIMEEDEFKVYKQQRKKKNKGFDKLND